MIYLADLWSHKAKWRFWDHQLYLSSFSIIFFWSSVHCILRWQGQHHNNVKSSKHFQGAKLTWHGGSFRAYKKWKLLMFVVVLQTLSELLTDYESVLSDCVSAGTYREELWLPGIDTLREKFSPLFLLNKQFSSKWNNHIDCRDQCWR